MKLNNKGWGVFQMLWMTGLIMFFFLLTIILIYRYYHYRGYPVTNQNIVVDRNHEEMIDDLNEAAQKYVKHYYKNSYNMGELKLTSDRLFKVGLFAKDLYGGCAGYAIAKKSQGKVYTSAYIKCNDYESPGYEKN